MSLTTKKTQQTKRDDRIKKNIHNDAREITAVA